MPRTLLLAWPGRTVGQIGEFCKETSPHFQYYLFGIKWFKYIHVGHFKSIDPKSHNALQQCIQIHQICVIKYRHYNHIKFEVSLNF